MAFPEGLPAHVPVLEATIQPVRLMYRAPPDQPGAVTRAAVDAPRRMRDACGRGLVEWQWGAVYDRGIDDRPGLLTGDQHRAVRRWCLRVRPHGAHATHGTKAS